MVQLSISPFKLDTVDKKTYEPNDTEYLQIRQIIINSLSEGARLNEDIAQLEDTLKNLRIQRERIGEYVEAHRMLVPPIQQLPVELKTKIFSFCLPDRNSIMSAREAPLLLGRVCRTWRSISHSTPALWSSIHVHGTPELLQNVAQDQLYCDVVRAWLKRSGDTPLSISFVDDYSKWEISEPLPRSHLLNTLIEFSHRWRCVNFRVGFNYFDCLRRLTPADVPLLENFGFEIVRLPPRQDAGSSLTFLQSTALHTVSIYNFVLPSPSRLPLAWDRITRLFFGPREYGRAHLMLNDAEAIMRMCPSLVACSLDITTDEEVLLSSSGQIALLHLEHLETRIISWSGNSQHVDNTVAKFFGLMDLPRLQDLKVTGSGASRLPFVSLLRRQPGQLENMACDISEDSTDDLMEILPLLSAVKRLSISSKLCSTTQVSRLNNTTLELMIPTPANVARCFCPLLEYVHFAMSRDSDITDDILLRFLLARTIQTPDGVSYLTHATFDFDRQPQRDILPDLSPAIQSGLKVVLNYPSLLKRVHQPTFQPYYAHDMAAPRDDWISEFD